MTQTDAAKADAAVAAALTAARKAYNEAHAVRAAAEAYDKTQEPS